MGAVAQAMLMATTPAGGGGATDPDFASVVQLAHFDGANGSTTFTNSCPRGNTMTATGTSAISTAQSKWGGASCNFTGGTSRLDGASSTDYQFLVPDAFTIEMWIRIGTLTTQMGLFNFVGTSQWGLYTSTTSGQIQWFVDGSFRVSSGSGAYAANTWTFISYTRRVAGSALGILHVDGINKGTWVDNFTYGVSTQIRLGNDTTAAIPMTGYMDDFRLSRVARYTTSNYTPPTAAFPNS